MNSSVLRFALLLLALAPTYAQPGAESMQVTTKSPKARALFEDGLKKIETLHKPEGIQSWREAAKEDPDCALAHILLTLFSSDPTEQAAEREKALASRDKAGPEEQLIIDWLANASRGRFIPAIQAMNEALDSYKKDKHLAYLAGQWLLLTQNEPARSILFFRRGVQIDPNFAPAWNDLAYGHARLGQLDEAFHEIQRYSELLPTEPNPQDSFAEISRMAGRYDTAIAHYRKALKLDPTFVNSQEELGNTYALMGEQTHARTEYALAIKQGSKADGVLWSLQNAATYLREDDLNGADAAFLATAQKAHENDFLNIESEAYRSMGLYKKDSAAALEDLRKAEAVLQEKTGVPKSILDLQRLLVLRARIERALHDGNLELAAATVPQLQQLADATPDENFQTIYHGGLGGLLVAQGKYADAIPLLEEDQRNPFSLQALTVAYAKTGAKDKAEDMIQKLLKFNEPIIEQAIVVLPFRKSHGVK